MIHPSPHRVDLVQKPAGKWQICKCQRLSHPAIYSVQSSSMNTSRSFACLDETENKSRQDAVERREKRKSMNEVRTRVTGYFDGNRRKGRTNPADRDEQPMKSRRIGCHKTGSPKRIGPQSKQIDPLPPDTKRAQVTTKSPK